MKANKRQNKTTITEHQKKKKTTRQTIQNKQTKSFNAENLRIKIIGLDNSMLATFDTVNRTILIEILKQLIIS